MALTNDEIIDAIAEKSVLELSELLTAFEDNDLAVFCEGIDERCLGCAHALRKKHNRARGSDGRADTGGLQ